MLKNYFKTAWRSLAKNKGYALINIAGLAIGIAACLLIFLIVKFETSFDNFHKQKENIYRVISVLRGPQGGTYDSGVPMPTAKALRIDFPQLKQVATIFQARGGLFTIGNQAAGGQVKKFKEDDTYFAEPQFFKIFNFGWLAGDPATALAEPNSIVLTQGEADKFLGDWRSAIGKTIKYENKFSLKVTGILQNMPDNTDFPLKAVISYISISQKGSDYFGNVNDFVSIYGSHNVFVVLPPAQGVAAFNTALAAFVKKHKPAEYAKEIMQLQPLTEMHYNTDVELFTANTFNRQLLAAISLIGAFLLIIACVNFINLATAQAVNRSKEVGIRKVMGSHRAQLLAQFMAETLIVTLLAVILAIAIAYAALPFINILLNIKLSVNFIFNPVVLLFLTAVIVVVTFLAGFYPALILSGFNPIAALKNKVAAGNNNGVTLRRALVVLQFCIAQILVIGTLVIISQMDYFRNKSLGFNKDAVITVPLPTDSLSNTRIDGLRNELMQQPGVADVSYSFSSPSASSNWNSDLKYDNAAKRTDFMASMKWADPEYFKLYQLKFAAGHVYAATDTIHEYIVNEALLNKLGVKNPADAIGKNIELFNDKSKTARIVGVVKDYNTGSLRKNIPPVIMAAWKRRYQTINLKIKPANIQATLASTERLWNNAFPDEIYEYQFLDDKIAGFYKSEQQLSQLYKIFAGVAILISCLGLYGLISFMAVQRKKEVGIRKTLGASVSSIVYLFSKEFTMLILAAFAIAAPIGWYFMNSWLQNFTYRITLGPGIFILAILVSVVIAWLTVGYKAVIAAIANPVNSLRSE